MQILLDEHLVARVADIGLGKTLAGVDVKASSATFLWAAPEQLQVQPAAFLHRELSCSTHAHLDVVIAP